MESTTLPQKRQKAHWQGKVLMLQGKIPEAVSSLSTTIMMCGAHMGLRSDLATCYKLLNMDQLFKNALLQIHQEYEAYKSSMHPISQLRTALEIGPLFEQAQQLGFINDLYQDSLDIIERELHDPFWMKDYVELFVSLLQQIYKFCTLYGFYAEAERAHEIIGKARQAKLII